MKIVGILSAYDESPTWLAAAITGFGRVCDAIVYADGAYSLYPGARPSSHPMQAEAVLQTCEAAGVECLIHRPRDVYWGQEVEKRNKTFALAAALEPDWVCVFDADYHVIRADADIVRAELEQTDLNVATYTLLDGIDLEMNEYSAKLARDNVMDSEWTYRTRDIYRWTPDLAYGPAHYTISGTYESKKQWVRGPELVLGGQDKVIDALHLGSALVAVHRTQHRSKLRKEAAMGYYQNRDAAGHEVLEDNWAETA